MIQKRGEITIRYVAMGFAIVAALALTLGCEEAAADSGPAPIEISSVYWIFENIDQQYWSTTSSATAFANMTVFLDSDQIGDRTVDSVKVGAGNLADDYWTLDSTGDFEFTASSGRVDLPYLYIGDTPHELYLDWRFTVTMSDGAEATYEVTYDSVNGEASPTSGKVYSPDGYTGTNTGMDAMIPIATLDSGPAWNGTAIEATISIPHSNVANGWAWCYAADGSYIGNTAAAFDWTVTDPDNVQYNADIVTNYTPGTDTTPAKVELSVDETNFTLDSSTLDFADVDHVVILLTDGYQWTGSFAYDFRSRTDQIPVSGSYTSP